MRLLVFYLSLFFSQIVPVFTQDMAEIFGYYESQIMASKIKKNIYQLYSNKLRIDLKSELSDQVMFAANFDYITYHGKTSWNILDFLESKVSSQAPSGMEYLYTFPFSDQHFLDNAYLKMSMQYCDLIVGKQQISLGTGYVWNPIDLFNIKSITFSWIKGESQEKTKV